jgi:hypothetical protein
LTALTSEENKRGFVTVAIQRQAGNTNSFDTSFWKFMIHIDPSFIALADIGTGPVHDTLGELEYGSSTGLPAACFRAVLLYVVSHCGDWSIIKKGEGSGKRHA